MSKYNVRRERRGWRLEPAALIPAESAWDVWRHTPDEQHVRDVTVLDIREWRSRRKTGDVGRSPFLDDESSYCDLGASCSDWLDFAPDAEVLPGWQMPAGFNPEGVFGQLVAEGFASPDEGARAVLQFAKIKGAAWAQRAALAVDQEQAGRLGRPWDDYWRP